MIYSVRGIGYCGEDLILVIKSVIKNYLNFFLKIKFKNGKQFRALCSEPFRQHLVRLGEKGLPSELELILDRDNVIVGMPVAHWNQELLKYFWIWSMFLS